MKLKEYLNEKTSMSFKAILKLEDNIYNELEKIGIKKHGKYFELKTKIKYHNKNIPISYLIKFKRLDSELVLYYYIEGYVNKLNILPHNVGWERIILNNKTETPSVCAKEIKKHLTTEYEKDTIKAIDNYLATLTWDADFGNVDLKTHRDLYIKRMLDNSK
jgi:hypothetical protein